MEFLVSSDGKEFITWRTIYPELVIKTILFYNRGREFNYFPLIR
jgi:hypothetical protein